MDIFAVIQHFFRHMTRDKNTLYVICPFNIGDFLINGGLCHALLKRKRKQSCVLIEKERFANSGLNFVGVKEVQYIPQTLMDLIRQYIYATRDYETDNYIYGHFQMRQQVENWNGGLIWNENLSFVDRYKENAFGLPMDTELIPPIIVAPTDYQKQRLHETYVLDKERTIILAPYANSLACLDESFWAGLVSELKRKNKDYVIYTNVASSSEKVVPDTAPIVTTFPELVYLAEKVNCFIGLRSGIFDLLGFTNAKLLCVYREIDLWYYDLKINFNHTNGKAFYIASASDQMGIRAFMQQNNINSISIDDINFYGRVDGKDVALNADSLLEKIISAMD